jgi:hypothetical protein
MVRLNLAFSANSAIFDDIIQLYVSAARAAKLRTAAATGGAIFGDFWQFVWGPALQIFVRGPGIVK